VPFITARYGASGPILDIFITVSEPRRVAMRALGITPSPEMRLAFIIDTGADSTMVNEQHMRTLGIDARGTTQILTSTSDEKPTDCNTYDVSFTLRTVGGVVVLALLAVEVIGRPLFNHSIDGMIGRDVLDKIKLTIDGPHRQFRIDC
jgi:Aspartyl protease